MYRKAIILFLSLLLFIPVFAQGAGRCVLTFSVTPDKVQVNPGDTINYTVRLKNIGKGTCTNTSYSFQYSDKEKFVSSVPAPRSGDYYWSVGTLGPNKQYVSTLVTKVNSDIIDSTVIDTESWASADSATDVYVTGKVIVSIATSVVITNPPPLPPTTPITNTAAIQAWVYPGNPSCNAMNQYSDGRSIDTLKPEYYTVLSDGTLRLKTTALDGCNAYSSSNVSDIKAHSKYQYVTVSGDIRNTRKLLSSAALQSSAITTLVDFAVQTGFTGIELDWEGFGDWTEADYIGYKSFVTSLQNSLHTKNKMLMIDAPAIPNSTYQGYFQFKYEDFKHIDYVAIMAYDYQYDFGVGEPVAPDFWITDTVNWAKDRLPLDKIIIGVASYGYHGVPGSYNISIDTYLQSTAYPGFSTRKISSDGEGTWINGGIYYSVQESSTLDRKKKLIESLGIKNISVWHLGGNQWFGNM